MNEYNQCNESASPRYKPGDTVIQKVLPHAPLMSVVEVERGNDRIKGKKFITGIRCCWFDAEGKYHAQPFHSNTLRHATDEEVAHRNAAATSKAAVEARLNGVLA